MSDPSRNFTTLVKTIVAQARDDNVTMLAAAIAYYSFVSLVPLLLLAVSVATFLGSEALADRVIGMTDDLLTAEAEDLVRNALATDRAGSASLVGILVLTWSGLRVFRGIDRAFSLVYDTGEQDTLPGEIKDGLIALGAIGIGVAAVTLTVSLVDRLSGVARVAGTPLVLVLTLLVAFLPLYYLFPDVDVSLREVLPGTAFAAGGWALLGWGFHLYAAVAGASVYGVLGGALLLLTWLYVGALILLLGAVINAILGGWYRPG